MRNYPNIGVCGLVCQSGEHHYRYTLIGQNPTALCQLTPISDYNAHSLKLSMSASR